MTTVKPRELPPKTPRIHPGVYATLRAFLPFPGSNAPFAALAVAGLVAVMAGMLLLVSSSLGFSSGGSPRFLGIATEEVFSTRVLMDLEFDPESLATKWTIEYGTSPNGPWTPVDSGEESEGSHYVLAKLGGREVQNEAYYLRKLKPETSYYVHFVAENKDGELKGKNGEPGETIPFKTLPVRQPEVDQQYKGGLPFTSFQEQETSEAITDHMARFKAIIDTEGAQTEYAFEYAPAEPGGGRPAETSTSWKEFTSAGTGTITVAEEYANVEAQLANLKPETVYYVRLKASNKEGKTILTKYYIAYYGGEEFFTTSTAKPGAERPAVRSVTAEAAFLQARVLPSGSETEARLEYATSEAGPWSAVPGGTHTISQAQAEATPYGNAFDAAVGVRLGGLKASTTYYVRLSAENKCAEGCGAVTSGVESFETSGAPKATTFAVHRLVGESLQLLGAVNPDSVLTSAEQSITVGGPPTGGTFTLTFSGHATSPIAYNASAQVVEHALKQLPTESGLQVEGLQVEGPVGGPYTVFFGGGNGEKSQPQIEANGSGLTPSGTVTIATTQQGGVGYDTHYHFQYVSQKSFEEHGWANAEETASVDVGSGDTSQNIGEDLPALQPGETYHYRIVATNTAPGTSPVEGAEQTLIVPAKPSGGGGGSCPNEALRIGLSAHLPDCRAYEQLTPVEKEGAEEPFHYKGGAQTAVLVGEDGEHAVLEASLVSYGTGSGAGQSPYLFSRKEGGGWLMTAGTPQLETGIDSVIPQVYSANLTQIAFESAYAPSRFSESPNVEYKLGPVGGPYTTVASVPRGDQQQAENLGEGFGWVAADGDFSKLVLETRDRTLVSEEPTPTKSGSDLYEYTTQQGLRQLNVEEAGGESSTIGSCGAKVAHGKEEGSQYHVLSGPHSVSSDGSRVFFEAVPGKNCSESANLYMRVNGTETVDIGAYKFLGATAEGTRLLLESGGELLGYDTETKTVEHQSSSEVASANELRSLGINVRTEPQGTNAFFHHRYTYWGASTSNAEDMQVYRYDSTEHLLECISCASAFDPAPKQPAFLASGDGQPFVNGGEPVPTYVSANGEFAFFTTPAALIPQDVDGEIPLEKDVNNGKNPEYYDIGGTSPSSDIYEWRASGVDGCVQVQGCLALITDGRGGYLNLLLGTADEGRDVIFYTRSTLSPLDRGAEGGLGEGNVYDARIDGGDTPRPPRPVECEADACSTPPSAPNDPTPSSLTFTGNGNVLQSLAVKPAVKSKKPKPKRKKGKRSAKKRRSKTGSRSKSKAHRGGK